MKKVLLIFAVAVAFVVWNASQARRRYQGFSGSVVLTIDPGTPATKVAASLVARGVLAHRLPFLLLYGLGKTAHRTLKAGEFRFDRPATPVEIYEKLEQGQVYTELVVIPEGSDRFDMARIFHDRLGINPDDFLGVTRQAALVHDLDPAAPTLEGYLFPDTYRFPHGAGAAQVAETMVARFRQVLRAKFTGQLEPGSPELHEVVTLASLIEKETPDAAERPVIAGVFARRLEQGMPLDCDPTVIYAARLAQGYGDLPQPPITRSQLDAASPYNTYRVAGLPPGAISSPGVASLRAALEPAPGTALYFVSNHHGGHVFARTLEEQSRNVLRYRREALELKHAGPGDADASSASPSSDGPAADANLRRPHRRAKREQQKRTHSRLPARSRTRKSRPHGDSPDSGGARPAPRG